MLRLEILYNLVQAQKFIKLKKMLLQQLVIQLTFKLMTGAINPIVSPNTFTYGNGVQFKLLLNGRPNVTVVPGPGYNYYAYGSFEFQEVL